MNTKTRKSSKKAKNRFPKGAYDLYELLKKHLTLKNYESEAKRIAKDLNI